VPEFVQGLPKKEKTLGPPRNALDRSTKNWRPLCSKCPANSWANHVATHMFTIHGKWWNQRLRLDGRH